MILVAGSQVIASQLRARMQAAGVASIATASSQDMIRVARECRPDCVVMCIEHGAAGAWHAFRMDPELGRIAWVICGDSWFTRAGWFIETGHWGERAPIVSAQDIGGVLRALDGARAAATTPRVNRRGSITALHVAMIASSLVVLGILGSVATGRLSGTIFDVAVMAPMVITLCLLGVPAVAAWRVNEKVPRAILVSMVLLVASVAGKLLLLVARLV